MKNLFSTNIQDNNTLKLCQPYSNVNKLTRRFTIPSSPPLLEQNDTEYKQVHLVLVRTVRTFYVRMTTIKIRLSSKSCVILPSITILYFIYINGHVHWKKTDFWHLLVAVKELRH